jgi:hypothetical protein
MDDESLHLFAASHLLDVEVIPKSFWVLFPYFCESVKYLEAWNKPMINALLEVNLFFYKYLYRFFHPSLREVWDTLRPIF